VKKARQQREGLPIVFFENRKVYKSASKKTGHHMFIELAGGDNIAKDEPVRSPELSPEYIVQRDPDVIVRRVSGDAGPDALEKMLKSIYNRPSLQSVQAVENENVHIIKSDLFISLRFPVGVAYYASWFYPELLGTGAEDFDPSRIHRSYVTNLYGEEEWEKTNETYVYP
jgi:iron complex transport system substrate-binding protein